MSGFLRVKDSLCCQIIRMIYVRQESQRKVFSHRNLNFQGTKRVLDSYLALNYLSDTQTRGGT